jgi:hypothetical protein
MTRDEQIDALLAAVQIVDDEGGRHIAICPTDPTVGAEPHQRFWFSPNGAAWDDHHLDPGVYGRANHYIGGRGRIQTMIGMFAGPSTKDLSQAGAFPDSCTFAVQATNIPDQVAANFWTGDRIPDDGHEAVAIFASTADTHRPGSPSIVIRADAIGDGPVYAVDVREVGVHPMPPTPDRLDYPGDAWVADRFIEFVATAGRATRAAVFHGRMMWDIGANSDHRPAGDLAYYLAKHLAEARG